MAGNSTVTLTLQLKGNAGNELQRISNQQIQATAKINQQWTQVGATQQRLVNTTRSNTTATLNTARAGEQLLRTNQLLERVLKQQERSYQAQINALRQQASNADKLKQHLQGASRATENMRKNSGWLDKLTTAGGAIIGAGMALKEPVKRVVDYDRDVHYAAQKLSDDPLEWKANKKWLNDVVVSTAKKSGVNRDDTFLALQDLMDSGAYSGNDLATTKKNLQKALFEASKSALATGGDISGFVQVGLAAKGRGLDEGKYQAMVAKADDLGAMSASDMAKALPSQLGKLPVDKMNDYRLNAQLIALNEVAMTTAGNASEASNNVNNLVAKMYSDDTKKRLKKAYDISLDKRLAAGKAKGQTDFDTFLDITDEIVGKDKRLQNVMTQLKNAKNDSDRKAILESQQAVFEQSGLAKIIPDMQALMALVAAYRNRDKLTELSNIALTEGESTRDKKYDYNTKELAAVGFNAFDVTQKDAEYQTLGSTVQKMGEMGQKVAELTEQYPALTTAMGTAEIALKTLAAAAGGAAIAQTVGGIAGKGGGFFSRLGGGLLAGGGAAAGGGLAGGSALAAGGQVLAAGAFGYGIGTVINKGFIEGTPLGDKIGEYSAKVWSLVSQTARDALADQAKYEQMIAQQQEQNKQAVTQTQLLQQLNSNISNLAKQPPPVLINGSSLLDNLNGASQQQANRHATIPYRQD